LFEYLEKKKVVLVYIPLIIYWCLLLMGTSLPAPDVPSFGVSDKFVHFGAYLGLAVLLSISFHYQNKNLLLKKNFLIATLIIVAFYGLLDEFHQSFIPGRSSEFFDWLADFLGAAAGITFVYYLMKQFKYHPHSLTKIDHSAG
jgi:VanZ family protein